MNLLKTGFALIAMWSLLFTAYGFGIKDIQLVLDAGQWLLVATLSLTFMHTARIG